MKNYETSKSSAEPWLHKQISLCTEKFMPKAQTM